MDELTRILNAIDNDDANTSQELLPLAYDELQKLVAQRVAAEGSATLEATDLVHEAYMRLVGADGREDPKWHERSHVFAAAAEAMRRILINRARRRRSKRRRNEGRKRLNLAAIDLRGDTMPDEMIDLDIVLQKLAAEDPSKAKPIKP